MIEFKKLQEIAQSVINTEAQAVASMRDKIDQNFFEACKVIMQCQGRVIVMGMGKSGHIGKKIAATLASTGTHAFFIHPAEASHGDLGMIASGDVVLAISYSGQTTEIISLLPAIKQLQVSILSMTGNKHSELARQADINLDISVTTEACPFNLAPTTSTTVMLVMGDALAIALLQLKNFTADDFARSHPGGLLGKRLLTRVSDLMHTGDELPITYEHALVKEALIEMSQKGFGLTLAVNKNNHFTGIFTDGDLRRILNKNIDVHTTLLKTVLHSSYVSISEEALAFEALRIMEDRKITALIILKSDKTLRGLIRMQDILRSGLL